MERSDLLIEPERRRKIHSVVHRIHSEIRFSAPPFPFEEFFVARPQYKVFERELPRGFDGELLVLSAGERVVHLRRDNPRPRVRFTLAHEIIHAELHYPEGKLVQNKACRLSDRFRDHDRAVDEREADYGAAALLIPLWMLGRYVEALKAPVTDAVVAQLARLFRVSERTMRIQVDLYERTHIGRAPRNHRPDAYPVF